MVPVGQLLACEVEGESPCYPNELCPLVQVHVQNVSCATQKMSLVLSLQVILKKRF